MCYLWPRTSLTSVDAHCIEGLLQPHHPHADFWIASYLESCNQNTSWLSSPRSLLSRNSSQNVSLTPHSGVNCDWVINMFFLWKNLRVITPDLGRAISNTSLSLNVTCHHFIFIPWNFPRTFSFQQSLFFCLAHTHTHKVFFLVHSSVFQINVFKEFIFLYYPSI